MDSDMLEIHPRELTFVFELQKPSSDSVQLYNNSEQYVAFKVKTTSPKKYCVRPNIGIIKPKSTCTFTVTMQPQREAPPYMQCKDKFLIQSTIVPDGTKDEEVTSDMFLKSGGKYIEEKKLRVVLISASPEEIPVNGDLEKRQPETILPQGDQAPTGLENPQPEMVHKNGGPLCTADIATSVVENDETIKATSEPVDVKITPGTKIEAPILETNNLVTAAETEILKETVDASHVQATVETSNVYTKASHNGESEELKDLSPKLHQNAESNKIDHAVMSSHEDLKVGDGVVEEEITIKDKGTDQNSIKDVEELKLKLEALNLQLNQANFKIAKLGEEQNKTTKEKEMLKQELAVVRQGIDKNTGTGHVYDGFPLLFVCLVALVSLVCGYLLRA